MVDIITIQENVKFTNEFKGYRVSEESRAQLSYLPDIQGTLPMLYGPFLSFCCGDFDLGGPIMKKSQ